jgi:cell division protein FtsL
MMISAMIMVIPMIVMIVMVVMVIVIILIIIRAASALSVYGRKENQCCNQTIKSEHNYTSVHHTCRTQKKDH